MKKTQIATISIAVLCVCLLPQMALADTITANLGNTASGLVSGTTYTGSVILAAQSGQPAPFNATCGSDTGSGGSTNCSTAWTFNYASLAGSTINSASITFSIYDIDSGATGNQVANFSLTSGENFTVSLNALAEALNSNAGAKQNEYDVFSLNLSGTSFAQLLTGSAQFNLALQGPGQGALGASPSNGGSLVYSTLSIDYTPGGTQPPPVPEPSSLILLVGGISSFGYKLRGRLQR